MPCYLGGMMRLFGLSAVCALLFLACGGDSHAPGTPITLEQNDSIAGLLKVELGRRLFYDTRLSSTKRRSCSHCHLQHHAFSDITTVSFGVHGLSGKRNAPTLMNIGQHTSFNWDGGVPRLHLQALVPLHDTTELDFNDPSYFDRFATDETIQVLSLRAFGDSLNMSNTIHSLASFQRTLKSESSAYDAWMAGEGHISDLAQKGYDLFEQFQCNTCHSPPLFTDLDFHNVGIRDRDYGRQDITGLEADFGKFKTPTLRNVGLTAPYMHNGKLGSLEEVLDNMSVEGIHSSVISYQHGTPYSDEDKAALLAFLLSLTDSTIATNPAYGPPR